MTRDPYAGEELTDGDLQGEIEMVGDLVVAAADSDAHLSQAEIDRVLGVECLGAVEPLAAPAPLPTPSDDASHGHARRRKASATS